MMLHRLLVFVVLLTYFQPVLAQIRATTESGNKVLLFDNGTWKYDERFSDAPASSIAPVVATPTTVEIDSSREITTDPTELFYLPSPRLVKYFGESGGNIRCKLSFSNIKGSIRVHFGWEFPVSDGQRYFGMFKEGSNVTLTMDNGETVALEMADENTLQQFQKSNYSAISNTTVPLDKTQLEALIEQPVQKMEVGWRRKPEEYEITQTRFLMDTLPSIF